MVLAKVPVIPILAVISGALVIMAVLLEVIEIIIHRMTPLDFAKPRLARTVAQRAKVTGFSAGSFCGTCSGTVPVAQRIPRGVPLSGIDSECLSLN